MLQRILKYFRSTSTERKGMFVLVFLLMLIILFYWIDDSIFKASPTIVTTEVVEQSDLLTQKTANYKQTLQAVETELFQFNPNTISKEEWEQLGFSAKQAKAIINFKKSGFIFNTKEDLKKLFVVDEDKYEQLAPYVVIPIEAPTQEKKCYRIQLVTSPVPVYEGLDQLGPIFYRKEAGKYTYYSASFQSWDEANGQLVNIESRGYEGAFIAKLPCDLTCYPIVFRDKSDNKVNPIAVKQEVIELNSADTTAFKTLKGVGSYYALKIIEYREKLGGFYEIEQLLEVYGLKPEVITENKAFIQLDTSLVVKININTATKEELNNHPYIKWSIANSIILYRANHGKYKSVQNIQNSDLVNADLYRKIVRYLTVK